MSQAFDARKSVTPFDQSRSLVAALELSQSTWLVGGVVPGLRRRPLKKLSSDREKLLSLLLRWRDEAQRNGHEIDRIVVACESGRDGFWLMRWLQAQGIEAYVIHAASVAVSREYRRAKTDRLDTEMLQRALLGWLRGEVGHCSMVAIPSKEEEDAKRPSREREKLVRERTRLVNAIKADLVRLGIRYFNPKRRDAADQLETLHTAEGTTIPTNTLAKLQRDLERLQLVMAQIKAVEAARLKRLERSPQEKAHAMVILLARVVGVGIETADMLVREVLSRPLRDRRAVARYAGLTGSPDESGSKRREKGLAEGRQCARALWYDPARLASSQIPEK